ncbi:MAG: acyltransferase, partial [Verrucomicrobiales bacterium]|nr:acyltransferase [Verrucomicrobiales bacterium]
MQNRLDKNTVIFIDAIRGLAALGVLITHCFDFGIRGVFGEELETAPDRWRWAAASIGHGGFFVWAFFVISGLCIQQSIARSLARDKFHLRDYIAARVTRIYPLFILGLGLAIAVWWFTDPPAHQTAGNPLPPLIASLASLQIFTGTFPNYMPSWSISNEMIYYIVWPCALLLLRKHVGRTIKWLSIASALACVSIATLWLCSDRFLSSAAVNGMWILVVLFPLWLAGAFLAHRWREISGRINRGLWLSSIPLCLVAAFALAWAKHSTTSIPLNNFLGILSIPGLVILVGGAHHAGLASKPRWHGLTRWLGQFSYP